MKDPVYHYNRELYGRSFLNCYQRQSLVMMAERRPSLHYLFHKCLISTDDILAQIVRNQFPRYSFESLFFGLDDLAAIGFVKEEVPVDTYADARPLLLDTVATEGYVLVTVDVFYLPHCPEYLVKHLAHTVILKGLDIQTGEWAVIDDNSASLLCAYKYPERVIAAGYDNNTVREVRYCSDRGFDEDAAVRGAAAGFTELLATYQDTHTLFSSVGDILTCSWVATERMASLLYDAFLILQGSRIALREYTTHAVVDPMVESSTSRIVRRVTEIQNALLVGKVTGFMDPDWMKSACGDLKSIEEELVNRLRAIT